MVRDNRHDAVYIFGAICPERGVGAAIITPAANMECMNFHLAEISTQVAPGSIAAVIWWRRLAPAWQKNQAAAQHRAVAAATLRPRVELHGECLGLSAGQQTLRLRLGWLQRDFGGMRRRMELARQRSSPNPFHRNEGLGNSQCLGQLVLVADTEYW